MPSFASRAAALSLTALVLAAQTVEAAYSADKNSPDYRRPIPGYIPKAGPAVIFTLLFAALAVCSGIHYSRRRMIVWLPIGLTFMARGFVVRIAVHANPWKITTYAISNLFILLSPCAFLACCYQLLGLMANSLGPDTVAAHCLLIRTSRITKIFVSSDLITLWIMGGGSGMQMVGGTLSRVGHYAAMGGLILQLLSFSTFMVLLAVFGLRVRKMYPELWYRSNGSVSWSPRDIFSRKDIDEWKVVYYVNIFASAMLFVRCIFRVIEYAQGFDGAIATNETYVYCLDSLPIFIGMSAFIYFWPKKFLPQAVPSVAYGDIEATVSSPASGELNLKTIFPHSR